MSKQKNVRFIIASFTMVALGTTLALVERGSRQAAAPQSRYIEEIEQQIPGARSVLRFSGNGFQQASASHFKSSAEPGSGGDRARTVEVHAPVHANGQFVVGSAGLKSPSYLTLDGATAVQAVLEDGRVVYPSVYPSTDIVAVRDAEHFELAYVIHDVSQAPTFRFELAPPDDAGSVVREPQSGAVIVRGANQRPSLRVEPPVAIDRTGQRRVGRYDVGGHSVRIDLSLDGLVAPVVLDPLIAIPFWTMISDARAPGAVVYDSSSDSKETHIAFDPARGSTLAIRPIRSQQIEDSAGFFAELTHSQFNYVSPISRVAGPGGPTPTPALTHEWQRVYYAESETYEWSNHQWSKLDVVGLPGLIDPSLAFDAVHQRMVVAGGQSPDRFACYKIISGGMWVTGGSCVDNPDTNTYEFPGDGWTAKPITGAPPPRVRSSMTTFSGGTLLFGGRHMAPYNQTYDAYVDFANRRPFPDNFAEELLSDTWVYNGLTWEPRPSSNPPPGRESAQLVFDARRNVAVLVGGYTTPGVDNFDLWEFDGTDWVQRFAPNDPALPRSLRGRSGVLAFYNPARGTTMFFGGVAQRLDTCTLSDAQIADQSADATRKEQLSQLGCIGGYMHDSWEWDGATLRQLTRVAFGGYVGKTPVFRQISEQASWGGAPPTPVAATEGGKTPLWGWRYDGSSNHYPLRSKLERAFAGGTTPAPIARTGSTSAGATVTGSVAFVSPLFASSQRPQLSFDTARGVASIFMPEDGRVFETDGTAWFDRSPVSSPFSTGGNDFYAAAWDSIAQRIVLFDPISAATWVYTDAGAWTKLNPSASPSGWAADPTLRRKGDLDRGGFDTPAVQALANAMPQMPRMTFDRSRGRAVMLYRGVLWEFDGTTWTQKAGPPGWSACTAATVMTYDGQRAKTVAVGCKTPGETMEWDGSTWRGPLPGPYQDLVTREGGVPALTWWGSLQLTWAHPNSLFESSRLGGVAMFDSAGTLRTWNGNAWVAGPALAEQNRSDAGAFDSGMPSTIWLPPSGNALINTGPQYGSGTDFIPLALFPPAIEDGAHDRILAFRDGETGLRALDFLHQENGFQSVPLGSQYDDLVTVKTYYDPLATRLFPHPFELLSAEHIYSQASSDPQSRIMLGAQPYPPPSPSLPGGPPQLPRDLWRIPESEVNTLFWPFRLFVDPASKRVRLLTDRGAVWELGAELRQGIGNQCSDDSDCFGAYCVASLEHPGTRLCCNRYACGSQACQTCEGDRPGICQFISNKPEPYGRCGTDECAGTCGSQATCEFTIGRACGSAGSCADGIITSDRVCGSGDVCVGASVNQRTTACPGNLRCGSATSCLTQCTTNADCEDPRDMCAPDGKSCIPDPRFDFSCNDGILSQRGVAGSAPCPGNLGCADAYTCKSTCMTRMDCESGFMECTSDAHACATDAVSVAATAQGVTPSKWKPPARNTPKQLGDMLLDAGLETDDAGRILLGSESANGLTLAFDPNSHTPLDGFQHCLARIQTCREQTSEYDGCVAAAPRCASSTPADDPAGFDCCPSECLLEYFDDRKRMSAPKALLNVAQGMCYPGLQAYLRGVNSP
jgi:hypothetical protein